MSEGVQRRTTDRGFVMNDALCDGASTRSRNAESYQVFVFYLPECVLGILLALVCR